MKVNEGKKMTNKRHKSLINADVIFVQYSKIDAKLSI